MKPVEEVVDMSRSRDNEGYGSTEKGCSIHLQPWLSSSVDEGEPLVRILFSLAAK